MSRIVQALVILSAPLSVLFALFVIDRAVGLAGSGGHYVVRFDLPGADTPVDLPRVDGPPDSSRPLVVIDPGHGGFDPGAGTDAVREKDVALKIALAIRKQLLANGGIRVALTRDTDRFVSLQDRPDIARRLHADLFISIHADSAESDSARGASVYVLSQKGSSQAAERFAARENGADRINGVSLSQTSSSVGAILLDLSQRGAQAGSAELAELILRELREADIGLHHGRVETAALAVLKAPDIPSILFETGYINNADDYAFLKSAKGQKAVAEAAARAVRVYFARQAGV
ncbi:N-acetylmuramoyl-L-alanine amidase family protein [Novosphingobium album (ex Hu et al. 2023)]|uniref:N-acetylmuramoyl-L-alanine amidase n=1 Tax=Novosphingobium album (ex Hu et al. 2023) TaxID=2930093 RepID=A0ABT0AYC5_9SPHN|nr:N-acetylmuramoyl-L-alanine amidase [Novosphingobium album (ex Hu et al. 2023)]MCJ2177645.1 N-acetylmuramoyl-L-alanine amidase [Novosphingobium album (ex Hu et al. 2023)]